MGFLKGRVTIDSAGNVFKALGEWVERDRVPDPNCVCRGTFTQTIQGQTVACRHC